jgi:hypothetical protein
MQKVQQRPPSAFVNIEGNACTADVFAIHVIDDRRTIDVIATHRGGSKAVRADSESQKLAMKIFSWSQRWRLIGARQNRFFGRIAATDSQGRFSVMTMDFGSRRRIDAESRALIATAMTVESSRYGTLQMPSLDFKRTLTAVGSALPPEDFIT